MTLVPAFEIGVWNAWIFVLVFIVYLFVLMLIFRSIKAKSAHSRYSGKAYKYMYLLIGLVAVYSIFLPLLRGTGWFYAGSAIFFIGLAIIALTAADVEATPEGEVFARGIYSYTRHPMYIGYILVFIGSGIASASWLVLVAAVLYIILIRSFMIHEENECAERFGDSYQEYMQKTPRWIGLPKKENPNKDA